MLTHRNDVITASLEIPIGAFGIRVGLMRFAGLFSFLGGDKGYMRIDHFRGASTPHIAIQVHLVNGKLACNNTLVCLAGFSSQCSERLTSAI